MSATTHQTEDPRPLSITRWNRLEGNPRSHEFERAMRAEVRDALWMLAKQWQMGEFQGDDAGSPVIAKIVLDTLDIVRYQAGTAAAEALAADEPLETKVERRPLPFKVGPQKLSLDLRLLVGRRWLKLLEREVSAARLSRDYREDYLNKVQAYRIEPPNPSKDQSTCAHSECWQQVIAAAGRAMDGIAFLEDLSTNRVNAAYDRISSVDPADMARLNTLADSLKTWFSELISQPSSDGNDAWQPSRLEYQFGLSAQDGQRGFVMRADAYHQGHLDWYALERSPDETQLDAMAQPTLGSQRQTRSLIPTAIAFEGMPNTRWWAFEDRRTNFGDVRPDTTDLGKLLLMEFGLVYANDWFIVPFNLAVGKVAQIQGIALSNVFGERFWIDPVAQPTEENWGQWAMFNLSAATPERTPPASRLVLLPTVPKAQEGEAIEEVALIRDEMANMVFGIERRIPLASGWSKPGAEAGRELRGLLQKNLTDSLQRRLAEIESIPEPGRTPAEQAERDLILAKLGGKPREPLAGIRYQIMNSTPEHWIPFIPVQVEGDTRTRQLQRAAMPRILENDLGKPMKIRPRTGLLSQNLPKAYFLHEEQVPRAGVLVSQSYQRTRWAGGKEAGQVFLWLGTKKQTGRGEGAGGLAFDLIMPTAKSK